MRREISLAQLFTGSLDTLDMRFSAEKSTLAAIILAISLFPAAATAGSAEAGKAKSVTCAACHGADGNSSNPEWPSLAGQHEKYIVDSLKTFKSGARQNVLMNSQAMILDEQAMEDLAAYYAQQTITKRTADPELVDQGERLYRSGNKEKGVSACIACHGPAGRGNPLSAYPALAGQHAKYTATQLLAYRSNARETDANQMMRSIAEQLTEDEIEAVASYIQGLQ